MERIIIERLEHGFNVIQGDKYSEELCWDEMLGLIATLTKPDKTPHRQWMKTKEEHDALREFFADPHLCCVCHCNPVDSNAGADTCQQCIDSI